MSRRPGGCRSSRPVPRRRRQILSRLGARGWVGKPVAFVGHGSVGGVRAIEQWRQIVVNFSMPIARAELNFHMFNHWDDGTFTPAERHDGEADALLDQLEELLRKSRA